MCMLRKSIIMIIFSLFSKFSWDIATQTHKSEKHLRIFIIKSNHFLSIYLWRNKDSMDIYILIYLTPVKSKFQRIFQSQNKYTKQ